MPRVVGLDIGGANLKAADETGLARTRPFALWKQPGELAGQIRELLASFPTFDSLAVTMTAELCDCFESKCDGVNAVLDAVDTVAGGRRIQVWQTTGLFASIADARRDYLCTAAANWLALATFAGRYATHGPALLLDIGSTTTDLIPLLDGTPVPLGRTDPERIVSRELLYQGVLRTPICAVTQELIYRDRPCRPAAELFATTRDVHLLAGDLREDAGDTDTADGRPATRAFAHARLARMLCADAELLSQEEAVALARQVARIQEDAVLSSLSEVTAHLPGPPDTLLLAGVGEFLGRAALKRWQRPCNVISLAERLDPEVSRAACAHALAVLATERS